MGGRKYFGTDGIRGRVGQGVISADFVLRLGNALGRVLVAQRGQDGRRPIVIIGKETRISGYMFEVALEAGLVAAGADVQLLGPLSAPSSPRPSSEGVAGRVTRPGITQARMRVGRAMVRKLESIWPRSSDRVPA